ncbi:sigma-70 family RNA polymerase sigma factor [Albimonas sp. CAU 1670]|uniref:sigma-70 family RNA polymerase sigma factor n=1 Tax=Albimonas sp. CAU 1670 TaxID=3032599 RepID=UPI0023D98F93|nr:sigma-70 family RNA polymerase sigma factor [Albimonas sp. CAU 1670]MDF2231420.1 sigma-70 family RNA polymerase sigma factor [Albimonas sp. CAU 1670]
MSRRPRPPSPPADGSSGEGAPRPPGAVADPAAAIFLAERPRLVSLAYRMLGSVAEAEDAVQDAWLRWRRAPGGPDGPAGEAVENPAGWLTRTVTRLCLDRLRAARRRRESYVGDWLPEPVAQDAGPAAAAEAAEEISFALMLALERLSPLERAAFLLHDVFGLPFAEVAAALGREEAACRQLAARGRAHARETRPRFAVDPDEGARIAAAFFEAAGSGDAAALTRLLADQAVLRSDGGGRARAALNPILGAERIARFFAGIARKPGGPAFPWSRPVRLNGLPGQLSLARDGMLQTVAIELQGPRIAAVYITRNPDKLRHLLPLVPPELRPRPPA